MPDGEQRLRLQLVVNAVAALVILVVTTVFSIYKPRGVTPYGQRALRRQEARR